MLGRGGFGLISTSNFYVPQVNLPGSMASFVRPAVIPISAPLVGKTGLGQIDLGASMAGGAGDALGTALSQGLMAGLVQAYVPWIVGGVVVLILLMSGK
jgi:hypothetical protein